MIRAIKLVAGSLSPRDQQTIAELALVVDDGRTPMQASIDAWKLRQMAERMRLERDSMFLSLA